MAGHVGTGGGRGGCVAVGRTDCSPDCSPQAVMMVADYSPGEMAVGAGN